MLRPRRGGSMKLPGVAYAPLIVDEVEVLSG